MSDLRLGVICDGISRDLTHALDVMAEFGLTEAELQFVGDAEVGDHDAAQVDAMRAALAARGARVSCLSRHVLAGTTVADRPGDARHAAHMAALDRVIDLSQSLAGPAGPPLVRIMTPKKEAILFGSHGAEVWNVAAGAWDATLALVAPLVDRARERDALLVVETGNGTMVNSAWTARRLIDDLGAGDVLGVLWDPANACWTHERAYPDAYDVLADGYLGHVHLKDVHVDTPRATLEVRPFGRGDLGGQLWQIGAALRRDGYAGAVSLESVFHPGDGDFEAGFRMCVGPFLDAMRG